MNERIAGLIPNASRLIALQKTCENILPNHFAHSEVSGLDKDRLTISVPSQAMAAKLRQRLPELQSGLEHAGWTVEGIRVKVKIRAKTRAAPTPQKRVLSPHALSELDRLKTRLEDKGTKSPLADAIDGTLKHHLT